MSRGLSSVHYDIKRISRQFNDCKYRKSALSVEFGVGIDVAQ